MNSRSFLNTVCKPSRIVYSDASATGCPAFIAIDDMPVSHINWDSLQMNQSSAWRELHHVSFALKSFAHLLSGCDVRWGPCSEDCFASYKNCKVPRFYSKFFNPDSLGVDSLAFCWVGKNVLACATCFASLEGHPSCLFVSSAGNFGSSSLAVSPLLAPFGGT